MIKIFRRNNLEYRLNSVNICLGVFLNGVKQKNQGTGIVFNSDILLKKGFKLILN